MTLHIAKGRPATTYTLPLAAMQSGVPWSGEITVWNEDGSPANVGLYYFEAKIADGTDYVWSRGTVSLPAPGVIRWTFDTRSMLKNDTDVFRFTLDVGLDGLMTQRLIDARVPIRRGVPFAGQQIFTPEDPLPLPPPPGGWPDAGNTGPTGLLTNMVGDILANVPGAIVENLRLTGSINVTASDVTIRNCEINASGKPLGIDGDGVDDLKVQHVRVIGTGGTAGISIGNDATVQACDVQGFLVGIRFAGADAVIEGNYLHGLTAPATGLRSNGCSGPSIRANTLDVSGTAHVVLQTDVGPILDATISGNQFLGTSPYNVVVDIGVGAVVVDDVAITGNSGRRGSIGIADVDPTVVSEVTISDNALT